MDFFWVLFGEPRVSIEEGGHYVLLRVIWGKF
jgi:hypothetical protein